MGRYRPINVELNRNYRNDLNANFEQIEKDITGVNQEISRVEQDLDEKIDSITGSGFLESLEAARDSANESATEANSQAGYAKNQGDYAKQQGDNAKEQSEYATLKGDYANEKAILADQAASKADSEASNLSQLKIDVVNATQGANTAATNAESATNHANTSGDYAKQQGDYAKAQGDYAKQVADDISEQAGVTSINGKRGAVTLTANDVAAIPSSEKGVPNGVAATNAEGKVVDAFGNEVEGKMKSVNHTEPDETGNVTIDVQTPADNALEAAKEYTDQAILNANQGEVKMVYYPYVLKATTDNQTEFTIPLETFDATNDFLQVVQNVIVLNKDEHYTVTGKTITLNQGVTTGTSLFITIIKNTLVGAEGAVNGNLIKDATLPLKKLAEPVVTSVNGQNGDINLSIPTKTSELTNDSNFATLENVSTVSTNLESHESKIASTTELGHVKVDGETITISETGVISSVGGGNSEQVMYFADTTGNYSSSGRMNYFVNIDGLTELTDGLLICLRVHQPTKGISSLGVNNFPVKWIKTPYGADTEANTLIEKGTYTLRYNAVNNRFEIQGMQDLGSVNVKTSTNIIYVDGSLGVNEQGKGGSKGEGAFKTINYALDQVKKFNFAEVVIRVAGGTYNEDVNGFGFFGKPITIVADDSTNPPTITSITINRTDYINLMDLKISTFIRITNSINLYCSSVKLEQAYTSDGIVLTNVHKAEFNYCVISNKKGGSATSAIFAINSDVTLNNISGTQNDVGLYGTSSTFRKGSGYTLTAATAQMINSGSQVLT